MDKFLNLKIVQATSKDSREMHEVFYKAWVSIHPERKHSRYDPDLPAETYADSKKKMSAQKKEEEWNVEDSYSQE